MFVTQSSIALADQVEPAPVIGTYVVADAVDTAPKIGVHTAATAIAVTSSRRAYAPLALLTRPLRSYPTDTRSVYVW
jgi:hypothetical protein